MSNKLIIGICMSFAFLAFGCKAQQEGGTKQKKSKSKAPASLQLLKSEMTPWAGGVQGSGRGMFYDFYMIMPTGETTIDSVWIDDRLYFPEKKHVPASMVTDTVTYRCSFKQYETPSGKLEASPKKSLGPKFSGAALILYGHNGARKKMIVEKFEKTQGEFFP